MNSLSNVQEKLVICGHGDSARRGAVGRGGTGGLLIRDCGSYEGLQTVIVNCEQKNTSGSECFYL
jgi:hypothetical protein